MAVGWGGCFWSGLARGLGRLAPLRPPIRDFGPGVRTLSVKCCRIAALALCFLDKLQELVIICLTIGGIDVTMFRMRLT